MRNTFYSSKIAEHYNMTIIYQAKINKMCFSIELITFNCKNCRQSQEVVGFNSNDV